MKKSNRIFLGLCALASIAIILAVISFVLFYNEDNRVHGTNTVNPTVTVTKTPVITTTPPNSPKLKRTSEPYQDSFRQTIFSEVNKYRISKGLQALYRNTLLDTSACDKNMDMNNKLYWAHYGPNGETPWQFMTAAGFMFGRAGENLAISNPDPIKLVKSWENSEKHNENLINPVLTDVGYCEMTINLYYKDVVDPTTIKDWTAFSKVADTKTRVVSVVQHLAEPIY